MKLSEGKRITLEKTKCTNNHWIMRGLSICRRGIVVKESKREPQENYTQIRRDLKGQAKEVQRCPRAAITHFHKLAGLKIT